MKRNKIIIVCGPTGAGKTNAAIEMAENFNGEIVSADAMQVYRYMDIGTAKPSFEEKSKINHHLIDVVDPDQHFDAALYKKLARIAIDMIYKKGKTVFVVGGTGLYIKALIGGIFESIEVDSAIRQRLKEEIHTKGLDYLYKRLQSCDPESSLKIHPNDWYRIVRALEVFETTGEPISYYHKQHGFSENEYETFEICLMPQQREILYERIDKRVDMMINQGFQDEVVSLLKRGYSSSLKSMQSLGYRHMCEHIENNRSLDEAISLMKRDTRHYAKRQLTWFRSNPNVIWVEPEKVDSLYEKIGRFIVG